MSKTSLCLHRKTIPKCEGSAHQSVLGVDGSEGTMLAQMRGVAQHGRITRLNHRPSRAPWIGWRVEAFCQGASSRGGWSKKGEGQPATGDEETMKATYETCHITVMASFNCDALFSTQAPQGAHWHTATAPSFTPTSIRILWGANFTTVLAIKDYSRSSLPM